MGVTEGIWNFYLTIFAIMIILAEIRKPEKFLYYFTFLKSFGGRGLFILFVGTLLFDVNAIYRFIIGVIFCVIGVTYIIIYFKTTDLDDERDEREEKYKDNSQKVPQ